MISGRSDKIQRQPSRLRVFTASLKQLCPFNTSCVRPQVQALALDRSLNLQDRAWSTLAAAQAVASELDTKYGVTDKALNLVDKAKSVDAALAGGRGAALAGAALNKSTELAEGTVEYIKNVVTKFESYKAANATEAGAAQAAHEQASAGSSPS